MSSNEIVSKIEALKEWEALAAEAAAEIESLKDAIKAEMTARGVEELQAGQYIARYTEVISNRFDSTAFKKVMPDVYKAYTKPVTSRRFSVAEEKPLASRPVTAGRKGRGQSTRGRLVATFYRLPPPMSRRELQQ